MLNYKKCRVGLSSTAVQFVEISLGNFSTHKEINMPSQFSVIHQLTQNTMKFFIQVIYENKREKWFQNRAMGNLANDWSLV